MKTRILKMLKDEMAFELKKLYLVTKVLFYSIANTPFVFVKRPRMILVMTVVIWGGVIGTYVSLARVGGITESTQRTAFIAAGVFVQLLFLGGWCGLPGNTPFWKFGKSFAKYVDEYCSEQRELRRKRIQSTMKDND